MIAPDDPRHGEPRGFHAGCRETCCKRALARYEKRTKHRRANGITWAIPAQGTQRRIQALMALGWCASDIAHEAGYAHRNRIWQIAKGQKGKATRYVERKTYRNIAEVYERMSMKLPPQDTATQRVNVTRSRNLARERGWAPPLAWDCIDTDAAPQGVYAKPAGPTAWHIERTAKRLADLEHAVEHGHTLVRVCADLGVSRDAIERWCERHDRRDIWRTLVRRDADYDERRAGGQDAA